MSHYLSSPLCLPLPPPLCHLTLHPCFPNPSLLLSNLVPLSPSIIFSLIYLLNFFHSPVSHATFSSCYFLLIFLSYPFTLPLSLSSFSSSFFIACRHFLFFFLFLYFKLSTLASSRTPIFSMAFSFCLHTIPSPSPPYEMPYLSPFTWDGRRWDLVRWNEMT